MASNVVKNPVVGMELGYEEIVANATTTANFLAEVDVPGLAVTVPVGTRPILVRFVCGNIFNTTAGDRCIILLKEGSTQLATNASISTAANQPNNCVVERRLAPSAGSHTYKVMFSRVSAGTATIDAVAGSPAFIQVVQL